MVTITGNTYPVRQRLKELGGRWNAAAQGWDMPDERAEQARAIVAEAGPAPDRSHLRPRARRRSHGRRNSYAGYTRFSSGAEVYRNPKGRCEDAPCCGCCS